MQYTTLGRKLTHSFGVKMTVFWEVAPCSLVDVSEVSTTSIIRSFFVSAGAAFGTRVWREKTPGNWTGCSTDTCLSSR
jgi:hypothetical protein